MAATAAEVHLAHRHVLGADIKVAVLDGVKRQCAIDITADHHVGLAKAPGVLRSAARKIHYLIEFQIASRQADGRSRANGKTDVTIHVPKKRRAQFEREE